MGSAGDVGVMCDKSCSSMITCVLTIRSFFCVTHDVEWSNFMFHLVSVNERLCLSDILVCFSGLDFLMSCVVA